MGKQGLVATEGIRWGEWFCIAPCLAGCPSTGLHAALFCSSALPPSWLSWPCLASLLSLAFLAAARDGLSGHSVLHELFQRRGPCSTVCWHKPYLSLLSDPACWVSQGYRSACALLAMHHTLPCPASHSSLPSLLHYFLKQKLFQFQRMCKYWFWSLRRILV